jgi:predicted transcriptional regulator
VEAIVLTAVTVSVTARTDVNRRVLAAFGGEPQGAHVSFASVELLWRTLTRKRCELLQAMVGQGPITIRKAARRVDRDVKAVHGDVHALLDAGVLERAEGRRVVFPPTRRTSTSCCGQRERRAEENRRDRLSLERVRSAACRKMPQ